MKPFGRIRLLSLGFAIAGAAVLTTNNWSALAEDKSDGKNETVSNSKQSAAASQPDSNAAKAEPVAEPGQKPSPMPVEQKSESANGEERAPANQPAPQPSGRTRFTEMKLSGSMCMSCLHEVERKLKVIPGVTKAKIEYPGERIYDYYQSPGLNSWARLTLSYDPSIIDLESLKSFLRTQGYHPFKIVEKER